MDGSGAIQLDRDDPAEAFHLPIGDLVRRVVGETRVAHRPHSRMCAQRQRHRERVLALTLEPQTRGSDAAQRQPGLEGAKDRARESTLVLDRCHLVGVASRHVSRKNVVVARQCLGGAGHHEVGAERQRLLP